MRLGLGLGFSNGIIANSPPTDIAWAGSHIVAEDAELGTVVGGALSFADPTPGETGTFSLADDAGGMFDVDGSSIIVTGVLDYETSTSHTITIRFTDSGGGFVDEVFAITVTDVSEDPPENPPPDSDPVVDDIENFEVIPYDVSADGSVKFAGKKKSNGLAAKFLHDFSGILALEAGTSYELEFTADFSLMAQQGRLAMIGVVFKAGNDFWIVGPRGDGSTGLHSYQIYGDDKWNQTSGFTEVDGGTLENGTQWGPIRMQIETSDDGTTVTMRTSADSGVTYDDDFTNADPLPFTNVSEVSQWGFGGVFHSDDSGPYSIAVTLFVRTLVSRQYVFDGAVPVLVNLTSVNRTAVTPNGFITGI